MKPIEILVVEDNQTMRLGIVENLKREGYPVRDFENGEDAWKDFQKKATALVITDLKMQPIDGMELLQRIKNFRPESEVLMISAFGTVEVAVKAMQVGAADFITKPFSAEELRIRVKKVAEKIQQTQKINQLKEENLLLQNDLSAPFSDIIGESEPMKRVFALIDRVAAEDSTILIEGESGTGKELVARAIHRKSPRADKPFIRINCAALNDNLLESELFGHEKGAFTGAIRRKKGRFELADGGTLFLDEIGDVSPNMQVKLLRALQEKEFERVGGEETISVDVRIIAATNRNLQEQISRGRFREDLYYRISVIPIKLPSLRQRREDIPLLVNHFLSGTNRRYPRLKRYISREGMQLLMNYSWPGNIRELENVVERLVVISTEAEIDAATVAQFLGGEFSPAASLDSLPLDEALYAFEKNLIIDALQKANGVKNRAAKLLGIRTSALYYKLEKFGLLK